LVAQFEEKHFHIETPSLIHVIKLKKVDNVKHIEQYMLLLLNILNIMTKKGAVLLPKIQQILDTVGEHIKLARLRRKFSSQRVAERAGISRNTLISIEKGRPNVSIGHYLNVLKVLGLERDFLNLAKDDELGRKLQDAELPVKERAPKRG